MSSLSEHAQSSSPLHILVADDSLVNRRLAVRLLELDGHVVTVVANGFDAVNQLRGRRFGAVLMDVEMPVMDGLAATRAIREWEKDCGIRTPIVALTTITDREACFSAGMDAFLTKPLRMSTFRQTLNSLLARTAA